MMLIEFMTTRAFEEGLKRTNTVIIPLGSIEEHGPHLPMNTDIYHAYEIAKRASEKITVFVSPPISFGVCRSTADFPGTIGVRSETLKSLIIDVAGALYHHGLKKFILYSGHAGMNHMAALYDATDELMRRYGDTHFAVLSDFELMDNDFFALVTTVGDSHAGEIETSWMLSLAPDLIGEPPEADFPKFKKPFVVRNTREKWSSGVWGNPRNASQEKGDAMIDIMVKNLVSIVGRIAKEAG